MKQLTKYFDKVKLFSKKVLDSGIQCGRLEKWKGSTQPIGIQPVKKISRGHEELRPSGTNSRCLVVHYLLGTDRETTPGYNILNLNPSSTQEAKPAYQKPTIPNRRKFNHSQKHESQNSTTSFQPSFFVPFLGYIIKIIESE